MARREKKEEIEGLEDNIEAEWLEGWDRCKLTPQLNGGILRRANGDRTDRVVELRNAQFLYNESDRRRTSPHAERVVKYISRPRNLD
jgi:hypothetical protein